MTQACCELEIKTICSFADDEICNDCVTRIEDYLDDMALDRAAEEYYEAKYGTTD